MELWKLTAQKLNKQPNNSNSPLRGAAPSHNQPQPSFHQYPPQPSHIPPNAFPTIPPNPYPGFHTPQIPIGGPRALPAGIGSSIFRFPFISNTDLKVGKCVEMEKENLILSITTQVKRRIKIPESRLSFADGK